MRFHDSPPVTKSKKLSIKLFGFYSDEFIIPHLMILKRYSLFGVYIVISRIGGIFMHEYPKKVLISSGDIENICNEFIQKNNIEKRFGFCLGIILPAWLSVFALFKDVWTTFDTVYVTILIILTLGTVILGYKVQKNKVKSSIVDQINNKSYRDSAYTALFIIARIRTDSDGRKRIQVLVQYKEKWGCNFLPYLEIDKNLLLEQQEDKLLNGLADKLEVNSKDLRIRHLEEAKCYSIKISVPEQEEKLFIHEFYTVTLNRYLENGLLNRCKWMNIDTLADDINTVRHNSDVVDNLMRIKSRIVDSFVSYDSLKKPIKIIWNITSKCSFDCAICATYCEQKKELSEIEKSKVLLAIMGMKDSIKELNFAGGDPLVSDDSKKIIKYAIEVMGKDKISVTTTGKAIGKLPEIDKIVFLNNCILSLDTFDLDFKGVRKSVDYNKKNVRCSMEFRRYMSKLRINVPIINTDLSVEDIKKLVEKINNIGPEEVSLIRLMPVGRQSVKEYPINYNAERFINIFKQDLNSNIQLHLHCTLRCQYCTEKNKCTMLEQKIGIDCAGNVFACCWAGYLNCELTDNPFWLGNLLEKDLDEIVTGDRALELLERCNREKCSVFTYYNMEF